MPQWRLSPIDSRCYKFCSARHVLSPISRANIKSPNFSTEFGVTLSHYMRHRHVIGAESSGYVTVLLPSCRLWQPLGEPCKPCKWAAFTAAVTTTTKGVNEVFCSTDKPPNSPNLWRFPSARHAEIPPRAGELAASRTARDTLTETPKTGRNNKNKKSSSRHINKIIIFLKRMRGQHTSRFPIGSPLLLRGWSVQCVTSPPAPPAALRQEG